MNTTIKDVAKAAGVSVATVSRVLNNNENVTKATKEVVNQVIEKLNYSPNFLGRNLRKCETNLILVIIPTSEQAFYSEILRGMNISASNLGYDIISSINSFQTKNEIRQLKMLFNRTVDAVVMLATKMTKEELDELSENYNIALCCEGVENSNVLTVSVDDEQAGFDAIEALISKGHKRIGFVCSKNPIKSSVDREKGYKRALKENNICYDESYVFKCGYDFISGGNAIDYFLALPEPPTAIFTVSDILAIGAVNKALSKGLNVGKDIAILGFDNIMLSEIYTPSISTISQPGFEIGKVVIDKLIHNISTDNSDKKHYFLQHNLLLRQSTGD